MCHVCRTMPNGRPPRRRSVQQPPQNLAGLPAWLASGAPAAAMTAAAGIPALAGGPTAINLGIANVGGGNVGATPTTALPSSAPWHHNFLGPKFRNSNIGSASLYNNIVSGTQATMSAWETLQFNTGFANTGLGQLAGNTWQQQHRHRPYRQQPDRNRRLNFGHHPGLFNPGGNGFFQLRQWKLLWHRKLGYFQIPVAGILDTGTRASSMRGSPPVCWTSVTRTQAALNIGSYNTGDFNWGRPPARSMEMQHGFLNAGNITGVF